jgi:hypothetical protein
VEHGSQGPQFTLSARCTNQPLDPTALSERQKTDGTRVVDRMVDGLIQTCKCCDVRWIVAKPAPSHG